MQSYQQNPSSFNNYPRTALLRVTRHRPCPVCGKPNNCNVTEDGTLAYCRRVRSAKQGRDGGWAHIMRLDVPPVAPTKPKIITPSSTTNRASSERCADVYRALIREHFVLSTEHRTKLRERGLPDGIIAANGYASTPTPAFGLNVARALHERFGIEGVPGFYRVGDVWRMVDCRPGFFVPVRSSDGLIQGFQIRRDEGEPRYKWFSSIDRDSGASSRSPIHYANWLLLDKAQEVVITEGALKADCIAYFMQSPVIGIPGVSAFSADFAKNLRTSAPHVRRALIAYDRDLLEKPQVFDSLMRLTRQLEGESFQVRVLMWDPPAKGYDDYLLSQINRQEVAA